MVGQQVADQAQAVHMLSVWFAEPVASLHCLYKRVEIMDGMDDKSLKACSG